MVQTEFDFDGSTFDSKKDGVRLNKQLQSVFDVMIDTQWHTLEYLEFITGFPQSSISARLRDLRKVKFGFNVVNRRRKTEGTWEYQLIVNEKTCNK